MRSLHTPSPTSHQYVSARLRLRYVDWGNPAGPPLILLHGGRDHSRNWDWVAQALRNEWHIIAPDLRGHGDSAWSPDGNYAMAAYLYDLAQLVHQNKLTPFTIVGHSLGGNIALRFAGLYPEAVRKLVAIEGLGASPKMLTEQDQQDIAERTRAWIDEQRALASRQPHRYATIEAALARMQGENPHLSPAQARHLTVHGVIQNEDGSFSWKFDNYVRLNQPSDMTTAELHTLWSRISCPTLLVYGKESWASNPADDGRAQYFRNARVKVFERAGHWVHHDCPEVFVAELRGFLWDSLCRGDDVLSLLAPAKFPY
jgi:pimeloyl-ACP methyl ester carboxylesterase